MLLNILLLNVLYLSGDRRLYACRSQDMGGLTRDLFTLFGQTMATWGSDKKPMKRLFVTAGERPSP